MQQKRESARESSGVMSLQFWLNCVASERKPPSAAFGKSTGFWVNTVACFCSFCPYTSETPTANLSSIPPAFFPFQIENREVNDVWAKNYGWYPYLCWFWKKTADFFLYFSLSVVTQIFVMAMIINQYNHQIKVFMKSLHFVNEWIRAFKDWRLTLL